jgi:hypothetical protein
MHDRVQLDRERGVGAKDIQYGALFLGNPGTGRAGGGG